MDFSGIKNDYRILLLATSDITTTIVYNALAAATKNITVIIEKKESKFKIIKRRIKKVGLTTTIGQLLFRTVVFPLLHFFSRQRILEIMKIYAIDDSEMPKEAPIKTYSVNDESTHLLLKKINPDIILINGTRILSPLTLSKIKCPIINIHVGITPQYRGVHGGYWALFNDDAENFGVTIHFVDTGIDTGTIIKQIRITPEKKDNFSTYPILQYAYACKHLIEIVKMAVLSKTQAFTKTDRDNKGRLWYHPTIAQYLMARLTKKIK